jgi:hypothetical protein
LAAAFGQKDGCGEGIVGMKPLRLILAGIFAAACLCVVFVLIGCESAPEYQVDSYEQVKEELADQPDIIFPDISKYEELGMMEYHVTLYPGDRRIKNGYDLYPRDLTLGLSSAETAFEYVAIGSLSIEFYKDERNPAAPLDFNVTHRTVAMQLYEGDITEDANGPNSAHRYPDGSRIGTLNLRFDLNGYRYFVRAMISLTPDELKTVTYEEKMVRAQAELFVLVDDILDKGEIPR